MKTAKTFSPFCLFVFAALSGIGLATYFAKSEVENHTMGMIAAKIENPTMGETAIDENSNSTFQGAPEAIMGNMAMPSYTAGKMSNLDKVKRQIIKKQGR